jgi:hypothetical protein
LKFISVKGIDDDELGGDYVTVDGEEHRSMRRVEM